MNIDIINATKKAYEEKKKEFESSKELRDWERIQIDIENKAEKLINRGGYSFYSFDFFEINDKIMTINFHDHSDHSEHSEFTINSDIFFSLDASEIIDHDKGIQKKIDELSNKINPLHTADYIRTRDAIEKATLAKLEIVAPEWYLKQSNEIAEMKKEIADLHNTKYICYL
jgi:hypothetical protein